MYCRREQNSEDQRGEKSKTWELRREIFVNGGFDHERLAALSQEYIHWPLGAKKSSKMCIWDFKAFRWKQDRRMYLVTMPNSLWNRRRRAVSEHSRSSKEGGGVDLWDLTSGVAGKGHFLHLASCKMKKISWGLNLEPWGGSWTELLADCLHLSLSGGLNPRRHE